MRPGTQRSNCQVFRRGADRARSALWPEFRKHVVSGAQAHPAKTILRRVARTTPSVGNPIWTGRVVLASPEIHEDGDFVSGKRTHRAIPIPRRATREGTS